MPPPWCGTLHVCGWTFAPCPGPSGTRRQISMIAVTSANLMATISSKANQPQEANPSSWFLYLFFTLLYFCPHIFSTLWEKKVHTHTHKKRKKKTFAKFSENKLIRTQVQFESPSQPQQTPTNPENRKVEKLQPRRSSSIKMYTGLKVGFFLFCFCFLPWSCQKIKHNYILIIFIALSQVYCYVRVGFALYTTGRNN